MTSDNENLKDIANELYKLNNNIQSLCFIVAECLEKPISNMNDDGFEWKKIK